MVSKEVVESLEEAMKKWPPIETGRAKDLTNQKIHELTPLYRTEGNKTSWVCKCSCGKYTKVYSSNLLRSHTKSCGHIGIKSSFIDRTGIIENNCLFLEPTEKRSSCEVVWKIKNLDNNKIFYTTYRQVKFGTNLGIGNTSKGENKIKQVLKSMHIEFETQKTFNDCRNPKTNYLLRFDFYLPDYNCCVEYDGLQHFQETYYFSDDLKSRQYKDNIKDNYCKNNNIKIIHIPYWEYNKINKDYINKILK